MGRPTLVGHEAFRGRSRIAKNKFRRYPSYPFKVPNQRVQFRKTHAELKFGAPKKPMLNLSLTY